MKAAPAPAGTGEVNRGFEVFSRTLFPERLDELPVTLHRGPRRRGRADFRLRGRGCLLPRAPFSSRPLRDSGRRICYSNSSAHPAHFGPPAGDGPISLETSEVFLFS